MKLSQLSGDSSVKNISFEAGIATLTWQDGETDTEYLLRVPCTTLLGETAGEQGSVHIRTKALNQFLAVDKDSGRYIAPQHFAAQMKMVKSGAHLAIGLKATEYPLLLQIIGYSLLLACPIRSEAAILIEKKV